MFFEATGFLNIRKRGLSLESEKLVSSLRSALLVDKLFYVNQLIVNKLLFIYSFIHSFIHLWWW
jgi:hypothetical protein